MKKLLLALTITFCVGLAGCSGQSVEIPSGNVGKIQTKDGFQAGIRKASKFRLENCYKFCDRLVTLDVSDSQYKLSFSTYMPKDELTMGYSVEMMLGVKAKKYDMVFTNVPFVADSDRFGYIKQSDVYARYARPILNTEIPAIMSNFTIGQVASERAKVNSFVKAKINEKLAQTPFIVKHVGLVKVDYPEIITKAKERAAERKEQEDIIKQQRELDLLQIETDLMVDQKRREVEIQKAKTKALIAKQLMTPQYETLLKYETLQAMAKSSNKVIVPTEMLDGIAVQGQVK